MRRKKKPRRRKAKTPTRKSGRKIRQRPKKKAGKRKTALKKGGGRRKFAGKRKHKTARKKVHKRRKRKIARRIKARKPAKPKKKRRVRSKKKVVRRVVIKKPARKPPKKPRKSPVPKPVLALNTDFEFFYELRDLVLKSSPAEKNRMVERLNKLGRVKLAVISGIFINKENLDPLLTDLLIVGDDIDRRKLHAFLKATEAEVGKEVKFAVMDKEEFQYRLAMFDRFTRVLLESPHEKLINRLGL